MAENVFEDITVEEENQLPLPEGWMRVTKYLGDRNKDGSINNLSVRIYKNVVNQQEIYEHPFIVKATNKANKLPLPPGWSFVKENVDGKVESFYVNARLQLSLWDPPHLRKCLSQVLKEHGFENVARMIENPRVVNSADGEAEEKFSLPTSPINLPQTRNSLFETPHFTPFDDEEEFPPENIIDHLPSFTESPIFQLPVVPYSSHEAITNQQPPDQSYPLPEDGEDFEELQENDEQFYEDEEVRQSVQISSKDNPITEYRKERDWNSLLNTFREPTDEYGAKISHRVTEVLPPMTSAGINVLKTDIINANERVHQLLLKLRAMMTEKLGHQCSFLYYDENNDSSTNINNHIVTLASDIVTLLRQQPDYIIMTLSHRNLIQSLEMLEIAYIMVHRVLHPFSTDNSMTTALLLQSINYQLEELSEVEKIFSEVDSKLIISRALFVHNAKQAIEWNGLWSPLPMVPNVNRETVFACLMRVYSLRRDVTGYFRAIWRPILPSIAALFTSSDDLSNPVLFANIITLAHRFLATTYSEKSMTVFPVTATAVSRAIYEIAGQETLLTFTFNFLVLPNLIKIVCGDHDSLENEQYHSLLNISKVINKYYDQRWWFQNEDIEKTEGKKSNRSSSFLVEEGIRSGGNSEKSLKVIRSFIYMIWKLFSCSVYLSDSMITAITMSEFLHDHLQYLNSSSYTDSKLRNLVTRLRGKLQIGCSWLVKMPLDAQGSEYLGLKEHENSAYYKDLYHHNHPNPTNPKTSQETYELLDRRMAFLAFKPNEILNLSVISKTELTRLLNDILIAIENCVQPTSNNNSPKGKNDELIEEVTKGITPDKLAELHPIYQLINEFLDVFDSISPLPTTSSTSSASGHGEEQFLQLSFLYDKVPLPPIDDEEYIAYEYKQVLRGLKLTNRYEDTLIHLIQKSEKNILSNIFELLADNQWYLEPEFDTEFKIHHIQIAEKHTQNSKHKLRNPQYGLRKQQMIKVFPLFSQHNQDEVHPNHRSLASLQKDVIASYRFGSAQRSADVGTSLARQKVFPPKLQRGQLKVTTLPTDYARSDGSNRSNNQPPESNPSNRNRSLFTEPTIKQNASILAPTKSFIHSKIPKKYEKPNIKQKDEKFMSGMRDYDIIPTREFQMRYFRRRVYHQQQQKQKRRANEGNELSYYDDDNENPNVNLDNHHSVSNSLSPYNKKNLQRSRNTQQALIPAAAPKPFPEHLRNRIRSDAPTTGAAAHEQAYYSSQAEEDYYTSDQGAAGYQDDREYEDEIPYEDDYPNGERPIDNNNFDPNELKKLIHDYRSNVQPLKESVKGLKELLASRKNQEDIGGGEEEHEQYYNSYQHQRMPRSPSSHSSRPSRARSPRMPSPIYGEPQAKSLLAPTESVKNRFRMIDEGPSNEYYRDLGFGAPPELRKYDPPESIPHSEPFRPTKSKFYAPSGPRIPRVPDFLSPIEGEDVIYTSRSNSPISRNRSRSSSPGMRSRSSSHARPFTSQRPQRLIVPEEDVLPEPSSESELRNLQREEDPQFQNQFYDPPSSAPSAAYAPISESFQPVYEEHAVERSEKIPHPSISPRKHLNISKTAFAKALASVTADEAEEREKSEQLSRLYPQPTLQEPRNVTAYPSTAQQPHKTSFAEALAQASKEAAEQNAKIQVESSYAFNYLPDEVNSSSRNRVNLRESKLQTNIKENTQHVENPIQVESQEHNERDSEGRREAEALRIKEIEKKRHRETLAEREREREKERERDREREREIQKESENKRRQEEEQRLKEETEKLRKEEEDKEATRENEQEEETVKQLMNEASKSLATQKKQKSLRFQPSEEGTESRDASPTRIPIVRKKSLISDEQQSREMFLRGFYAIKVRKDKTILHGLT